MKNDLKCFLKQRGTKVPKPRRPAWLLPEFWKRVIPLNTIGLLARPLVRLYGPNRARAILNRAVGDAVYSVDRRFITHLGLIGTHGFIYLPGGCAWAVQGPGCAFCEFQPMIDRLAGRLPIRPSEFRALFRAGFATMRNADVINVFTAGSFLNPGEIPEGCQLMLARAVAEARQVSMLRVESRVQYVVPELVGPLVETLGPADKTLDVAIGLETQDDRLRNHVLRKGMSRGGFQQAVVTLKSLGARASAYVMLMPVDMSEAAAYRECLATVRFAFASGVDEVLLQARYSQQPGVTCPKLWTIARILEETAALGPVTLGDWSTELPEPRSWPKNCRVCTPELMRRLGAWRRTLLPGFVAATELPSCPCRLVWEETIE